VNKANGMISVPPSKYEGNSGARYFLSLGIYLSYFPFTLEETLELPPASAGGVFILYIGSSQKFELILHLHNLCLFLTKAF